MVELFEMKTQLLGGIFFITFPFSAFDELLEKHQSWREMIISKDSSTAGNFLFHEEMFPVELGIS